MKKREHHHDEVDDAFSLCLFINTEHIFSTMNEQMIKCIIILNKARVKKIWIIEGLMKKCGISSIESKNICKKYFNKAISDS